MREKDAEELISQIKKVNTNLSSIFDVLRSIEGHLSEISKKQD